MCSAVEIRESLLSSDPIAMCELLVGLGEVTVLDVTDRGDWLRVEVETRLERPPCPDCATYDHLVASGCRMAQAHAVVPYTDCLTGVLTPRSEMHVAVLLTSRALLIEQIAAHWVG